MARPDRTTAHRSVFEKNKKRILKTQDVCGFVGGALSGPRRKPGNIIGRDLITLDLDNLPANSADNILDKISQLGCAAVVYSTRKHHAAKPRLRVIIPTDRTMAAVNICKLQARDIGRQQDFEILFRTWKPEKETLKNYLKRMEKVIAAYEGGDGNEPLQ